MRVRLSYSVELEDVPDSVSELIESELFRIDQAKLNIGKALEGLNQDEPHLDLVAKSLDKARQTLGAIDTRLNECESILAGYERAVNPPEQPQVPMMAPPQMPRPPMPQPTVVSPTEGAVPQQQQKPTNPKIDPETREFKYQSKYVVSPKSENDEPADDQQFDGVDYTSPYEIPRESDK